MTSVASLETHEDCQRTERTQLQGRWDYVQGRWPTALVFEANRFTARIEGRGTYRGTYSVDPTQNPGAMDMTIEEGPAQHQGLTARCIYCLEDGWLWWCPGEPGSAERPVTFPLHGEGKLPTLVFRRAVVETAAGEWER